MRDDFVEKVLEAKDSMVKADKLIKEYRPFILAQASKASNKSISMSDDEFSIAMLGFHEAIKSYDENKGKFLSFASLIIRNRVIDYYRKEQKYQSTQSIYEEDRDDLTLADKLADERDMYEEGVNLNATKMEIMELQKVLVSFGVSLTDISENSPKQERTLEACRDVVRYAMANKEILDDVERTGKVPMTLLAEKTNTSKKTLERHRKYILAMLIIQTNGYEIIRDHISGVLSLGKGVAQ